MDSVATSLCISTLKLPYDKNIIISDVKRQNSHPAESDVPPDRK